MDPLGACIQDCANGTCLYELMGDPTEHHNQASEPALRPRVEAMLLWLHVAKNKAYLPKRCTCDDGYGGTNCQYFADGTAYETCLDPRACTAAAARGGFWGPFLD